MKRKESGFHVENSPMGTNGNLKLPTRRDYAGQAIVYSIIGLALIAGAFVALPAPFALAWPMLARITLGIGFLSCAASAGMGAKGFSLQHPLYYVLTAVQVLSSVGLLIWFVFGDNQLAVQWKILAAFIFGTTAFVLTLPLVMKIAFPGLMDQALNAAELENKKNRKIGKRD